MIFRVSMKTPDALDFAIKEVVKSHINKLSETDIFKDDVLNTIKEEKTYELKEYCKKWFGYDECITVEIDTDKNTCIVIPYIGE